MRMFTKNVINKMKWGKEKKKQRITLVLCRINMMLKTNFQAFSLVNRVLVCELNGNSLKENHNECICYEFAKRKTMCHTKSY